MHIHLFIVLKDGFRRSMLSRHFDNSKFGWLFKLYIRFLITLCVYVIMLVILSKSDLLILYPSGNVHSTTSTTMGLIRQSKLTHRRHRDIIKYIEPTPRR